MSLAMLTAPKSRVRTAGAPGDVILYLRVFLPNMTLVYLLSLTFQKNRLKNVVEYGST